MKILAIDTATEACSVALLSGNVKDVIFEICPQQHSQRILPMIDKLLSKHAIKITDLDALAYCRGPGSFTGVRIATGIVQGLALGADLPVIEVSTLAAMAQENYMQHGYQITKVLIDARMQEVYFGYFQVHNGIVAELQSEAVLTPAEAVAKFAKISHDNTVIGRAGTGWTAYSEALMTSQNTDPINVLYPCAEFILPIAEKAFKDGNTITVDDVTPIYLRDKVTWKKLPGKE
jgi:tRNA threonylcarbamoyladenosine biosynthesis protein TsaB